jgi:RHS repeat-associated protein
LDGSGSTDPNGLGLQYQWSETGGPTLNVGAFDSAGETTSFTPVAGGVYSFQLQVIDSASALSAAASISLTVKPKLPSAPAVTSAVADTGVVALSWASDPDAASYDLYQSANNVTFTFLKNVADVGAGFAGLNPPPTTTSISNLVNGTYYYAIVAKANGVDSDRSASVSAQMIFHAPTPTGLWDDGDAAHSGTYAVKWNSVTAAGTTITYDLEQATGNSSGATSAYSPICTGAGQITSSGGTSSCTVSNTANTSYYYYYKVRAHNVNGYSAFSAGDSIHLVVRPGVPGSFSPASQSASQATFSLSWGAASGKRTEYQVYWSTSTSFPTENYVDSPTSASDSVGVPLAATEYFHVRACNISDGTTVCSSGWNTATSITHTTGGSGGGDGCHPICPLVMEDDKYTMIELPPPASSGEEGDLYGEEQLSPVTDLVANDLQPVVLATRPVSSSGIGTLAVLKQERQTLVAASPAQPSELALQARFSRLTSPAPSLALASREHAELPSAGALRYAPPVYQAYAGAHLQAASGTPYRFTVQYNYDPASGPLLSVSNADTGFIYWRAATDTGTAPVDAFGHIVGYVDGNNVSTVSAYDSATGAIRGISTGTGASSAVQSLIYTWDAFGNLKQRCDTNKGLAENFSYDGLNRIAGSTVYTGASYSNSQCSGGTSQSTLGMQYDAVGNISSRQNTGITVGSGKLNDTYDYNDSSHPYAVTGVTSMPGTYAYDANGNMTSGNGRTITWNDDNLPLTINSTSTVSGNNTVSGSSTFDYSPDLQRYQQVTTDSIAGNSTTTYIGGLFEVVTTSGVTQYRHNIMAAGGVVAVHTLDQSGNATTAYIHADNLGSSDTITNDAGTVVQQASFDAFGLRRNPNDWSYTLTTTQIAIQDPLNPTISNLKGITDRGYTSQEQLDSIGLVDMNGRVYDPSIDNFISADPKVPNLFYSQSFSRYTYVYSNPLLLVDPSGFDGALSSYSKYIGMTFGSAAPGSFNNSGPGGFSPFSSNGVDSNNVSVIASEQGVEAISNNASAQVGQDAEDIGVAAQALNTIANTDSPVAESAAEADLDDALDDLFDTNAFAPDPSAEAAQAFQNMTDPATIAQNQILNALFPKPTLLPPLPPGFINPTDPNTDTGKDKNTGKTKTDKNKNRGAGGGGQNRNGMGGNPGEDSRPTCTVWDGSSKNGSGTVYYSWTTCK